MLELSSLCQCVVHPLNLILGISGALGMKGIHLLKKMCFEKMLWGISEMVNARTFKPYPLGSAPLKTYFSWDFWSSRNQLKSLNKQKMCFEKMLWGTSEMVNARALNILPLCSAPLKTYFSRDFWSYRNQLDVT